VWRLLKSFGRLTIGFGVFAFVLMAGAYLYLHSGPVDLAFVKPRLEAALQVALPGTQFHIGSLTAERDAFRREIIVHATAVDMIYVPENFKGRVENLTVVLPQSEITSARPKPKTLIADGVRGHLNWDAAKLRKFFSDSGNSAPPRLPWIEGLGTVRVMNAEINLKESGGAQDILSIEKIQAKSGLLRARHINFEVLAALFSKSTTARIVVVGKGKAIPRAQWEGNFTLSATQPQYYAKLFVPQMILPNSIPKISSQFSLRASDAIYADGKLEVTSGALAWPLYYDKPVSIKFLRSQFKWSPLRQQLSFNKTNAEVAGVAFDMQGVLNTTQFASSKIDGSFARVSAAQLKALWPKNAAEGGRVWIGANIPIGELHHGQISLRPGTLDPVVKLEFGFQDLQVEYRRPVPPLVGAMGTGVLDNNGVTLKIASGSIGAVPVTKGNVFVGPFADDTQYADIDASLAGDLTKLLTVLDSPPLQYISKFGQIPSKVTGIVAGDINLRVPMTRTVSFDDIKLKANAVVRNGRIPGIYAGKPLEAADLSVGISNSGLFATGVGKLSKLPLGIKWQEDFSGKSLLPTQYDITSRTTVADVADIGIDMTAFGAGPITAALSMAGRAGAISDGRFTVDLAQTMLRVIPFGVVKPIGIPAKLTGNFSQGDRVITLPKISVVAATVLADMSAKIPIDAGRSVYIVNNFQRGTDKLRGVIRYGGNLPLSVMVEDGELDLSQELLSYRAATPLPPAKLKPVDAENAAQIDVAGKLSSVRLLNNVLLKQIDISSNFQNNQLSQLSATARVDNRAPLRLSLQTAGNVRHLELRTEDAGSLARGLDLYRDGVGGLLTAEADVQGADAQLTIAGIAKMTSFRIQNAPALAKVLTLASLTGLSDTLGGRGIEFKTVEVPFTLKRGIMDIKNGRAIGPGLGITLIGQAARNSGQINMRGTIVPSYTLNSAIGKIPILGQILVGGKDQGLIGFNYRITGTVSNPKVTVARISGLAPGFLRHLFDGKAATVDVATP
jgi:AsmA-like C-terminal region/Protein of unknown function